MAREDNKKQMWGQKMKMETNRPSMGWNSYDYYDTTVDEAVGDGLLFCKRAVFRHDNTP